MTTPSARASRTGRENVKTNELFKLVRAVKVADPPLSSGRKLSAAMTVDIDPCHSDLMMDQWRVKTENKPVARSKDDISTVLLDDESTRNHCSVTDGLEDDSAGPYVAQYDEGSGPFDPRKAAKLELSAPYYRDWRVWRHSLQSDMIASKMLAGLSEQELRDVLPRLTECVYSPGTPTQASSKTAKILTDKAASVQYHRQDPDYAPRVSPSTNALGMLAWLSKLNTGDGSCNGIPLQVDLSRFDVHPSVQSDTGCTKVTSWPDADMHVKGSIRHVARFLNEMPDLNPEANDVPHCKALTSGEPPEEPSGAGQLGTSQGTDTKTTGLQRGIKLTADLIPDITDWDGTEQPYVESLIKGMLKVHRTNTRVAAHCNSSDASAASLKLHVPATFDEVTRARVQETWLKGAKEFGMDDDTAKGMLRMSL